jgi:hypothetical protein
MLRSGNFVGRLVQRRLARNTAAMGAWGWRRLIDGPYANAGVEAHFEKLEKSAATINGCINNIPNEVPDVDFEGYFQAIADKPAVVDIESQYVDAVNSIEEQDYEWLDEAVDQMNQMRDLSAEFADELKERIASTNELIAKWEEDKKDGLRWNYEQWEERYPGLKEGMLEDYWKQKYDLYDEEEWMESNDPNEWRKMIASGTLIPDDPDTYVPAQWADVHVEESLAEQEKFWSKWEDKHNQFYENL